MDIKEITLPSGDTYGVKDTAARAGTITGFTEATYEGQTTTLIKVGSTDASYVVSGTTKTATEGTVVAYDNEMFIWDGSEWMLVFVTLKDEDGFDSVEAEGTGILSVGFSVDGADPYKSAVDVAIYRVSQEMSDGSFETLSAYKGADLTNVSSIKSCASSDIPYGSKNQVYAYTQFDNLPFGQYLVVTTRVKSGDNIPDPVLGQITSKSPVDSNGNKRKGYIIIIS